MSDSFLNWRGMKAGARIGLIVGAALIVIGVSIFGYWALRPDYKVLFSDLSERDLAGMVAELDKMKTAYKVSADGHGLLVPEALVHKTRLALMDRDVPLHGAVGFELFNNMEFGTSEFVQKIGYQRALQGELSRTILAIDEVQNVRVHLALPEQTLFRKDASKAKASVTIQTKPGRELQPIQVQGIQRLVAASVPDILAADVTVLDQHGVAMSRASSASAADAAPEEDATTVDRKRGVETYLAQKAGKVLDKFFGAGESLVTVDAVFTHEQSRVTTEEVLPARNSDPAQAQSGVVVRERLVTNESSDPAKSSGNTVTNSETDYQTGKRTEQTVIPAGNLKQLNVAVVVKRTLTEAELQRVRDLVGASVGLNRGRGDVVTVQSMMQIQPPAQASPSPIAASPSASTPRLEPTAVPIERSTETPTKEVDGQAIPGGVPMTGIVFALCALAALAASLALARGSAAKRRRGASAVLLNDAQRVQMLASVRQWMASELPTEIR